ncbi:16S rRNA (cytosine967-C5)-methyltransferase [Clostridium acetobutylicum]|uniref:16S rRNA (cytosine(967)-C(5))-methyltransferase n=1 Tax=Clostridium acetobutylicum (strain ATCC 824 / DSM 792 / JCM 1419 / IAM 19013 / LMG 5710 / NBRC 13948 / NRRL B-527 / VKM B-1787 / 2291 / W) TaxID=272562 RepID=Q97IC5_CLOAB|nr:MULTISPECIES: 16S rRNA (cytosine(967)-C(5))-methyltransferase RsmB [Clostridium]AAK79691.1 Predicted rRNA methylase, SUN family [Clostridium acetobutylicum ATCC 824]ADZ20775.1 rRNA methylase, SUN family [Clostridium acetobutylicum EA 2018]AEI34220.1 rRNA methylase [Clostridium acetobutylicum DSM 1731]AWV79874.1 16S rRNA (cytosine(967)-C(5))-methyltransferase RsmB [Clostridium acetobutylicum]MBC2394142.1 16S rRNA (cytosine(967)-C(5))-methyltransferase RsmB [Clostridium acetobutylicum]
MNNTRKIVLDVLNKVLSHDGFSNIVLNKALKGEEISSKDKGLVTEIVYGTIKYKYSIDIIISKFVKTKINKIDKRVLNVLRMSIYQIRYLDKIPDFAAVNEAVNITKKYISLKSSKFVNAVLRNYLRNPNIAFYNKDNSVEKLCFNYSFEPWMVKFFLKQYKNKAEEILKGLNENPSITIRVNRLKTSHKELWNELEKLDYNIEEGYILKDAIRIKKGHSIENNPLFVRGEFTVQDESAMLVSECMDIKENLVIFDMCSAPGGKTTHMGELLKNTGTIYAFDLHESKIKLINENAKRLGVENINASVLDASSYHDDFVNKADRILVDAPCSGLGIIRKKPEIKWNKNIKDLKELSDIQKNILQNASLYLKKEGILLYSTCTLNKDENEKSIIQFLKNNPNFKVEPIEFGEFPNLIYSPYGVTILPNEYMDGFFMCKLKKTR